ncbi:MAG TPA: phosphoribosylamine--glycine ligase [Candidatus Alistipes intestinigallinarum]|uniref:Phosphoribosylamine--glycine ligase n=1 Tax=Candidatus Alistipes intestinigallinarum TaxID=2838440 RepID=A0A9D1Z3M6_9BACT|nr:phosphoribosylamine--glycine ligase [Candidatus Alistipes intestinigallinarum]
MKVLVIGGGGREHAIVDALSRSPQVEKIFCAPGNAGIARQAECVAIRETEVERLRDFAAAEGIGLTVVGPEVALAAGVVDCFKAAGLRIFGPTKAAARIESSKEFAKELMAKYEIPTAGFRAFTEYAAARDYVAGRPFPAVLKYDGLAAGKGVVIAQTMEEADSALKDMLLDDKFGEGKVVVEDYLEGPEFSFMCFVSGHRVWPMVLAQDHKRAYDGDKGPNTGGMGAYSPLPFITAEDERFALERILQPVADAMVAEGCPFEGVLYGGLMKTAQGIKVIEFNARFGDPETEVVLPRLKSDIVDIFCAVAEGRDTQLEWHDFAALGIVLASKGYPGSYEKGYEITGLENVEGTVYHMGTKADGDRIVTAGGRVLFVVGTGRDLAEARAAALRDVERIGCDNLFHRTDIGHWAFEK